MEQSSFGPTDASLAEVKRLGLAGFLDKQFAQPTTGYGTFPYLDGNSMVGCPAGSGSTCYRDNYTMFLLQHRFFQNAIAGPDQLRQRAAFALSQILVASGMEVNQPYGMAPYQHIMLNHAFGNFRDILNEVTLSPAMGDYLDMVNNDKPNPTRGTEPNENYAREVMQLFSIGVWKLNPDGSQQLDGHGAPIPAYDQEVVEGFAHALTGWTYPPRPGVASKWPNPRNYGARMVPFADRHDGGSKKLLDGKVLPAGQSPEQDLAAAVDSLFQHPNVGPFIGRQLIQHLTTSNPSPAYVGRVSAAFNDNGAGVRGDMKAVFRAILLDSEVRGDRKSEAGYGKLREPAVFAAGLVRTLGGRSDGGYLRSQTATMAQDVYAPASVFNYYPADYLVGGLQGPQFGIYNASTAFARANFVNALLAANGISADASVPASFGTKIEWGPWLTLAPDSGKLLDRINQLLFHGSMSEAMRGTIKQAVDAISVTDSYNRARTALYLAATSPQFQIQR
ncbi:DUF1800 domain-containing protein [Chitinimonas arctica]|uniref:DUF1800 domain-containing protein n=1 Tax=Chitinimonas arctica TaxID=2594795 RepID=UPI0015D271C8|nr:DUF1800 domain-containing protein [Chitinimonas arctica]